MTFTLDKRSFAYYDVERKDWRVETGEFEIQIGKSSRDIVCTEIVHVQSTTIVGTKATRNSTVGDLLADPATRPIIEEILKKRNPFGGVDAEAGDTSDMMEAIMKYFPLRALISFGSGMTEEQLEQILAQLNDKSTSQNLC